jgi:hypothetical protein
MKAKPLQIGIIAVGILAVIALAYMLSQTVSGGSKSPSAASRPSAAEMDQRMKGTMGEAGPRTRTGPPGRGEMERRMMGTMGGTGSQMGR